jgi:hypothetical protein
MLTATVVMSTACTPEAADNNHIRYVRNQSSGVLLIHAILTGNARRSARWQLGSFISGSIRNEFQHYACLLVCITAIFSGQTINHLDINAVDIAGMSFETLKKAIKGAVAPRPLSPKITSLISPRWSIILKMSDLTTKPKRGCQRLGD